MCFSLIETPILAICLFVCLFYTCIPIFLKMKFYKEAEISLTSLPSIYKCLLETKDHELVIHGAAAISHVKLDFSI